MNTMLTSMEQIGIILTLIHLQDIHETSLLNDRMTVLITTQLILNPEYVDADKCGQGLE